MADSAISGAGVASAPRAHVDGSLVGRSMLFSCESSCDSSCHAELVGAALPPPLLRHSSSPAGLLTRLLADPHGMQGAVVMSPDAAAAAAVHGMASRRLASQWSFSKQGSLPKISETGVMPDDNIGDSIVTGCNGSSDGGQSYFSNSFSVSSWDGANHILVPPSSSAKNSGENSGDNIVSSIDPHFCMPSSSLEIGAMDDLMQMQQDAITCRVRAKRGCATHPRSVAERERRTRISKRLKKLQDLVPNMDKQTSTSDMLDLAVHYITELQSEVERLKQAQENCSCSIKN